MPRLLPLAVAVALAGLLPASATADDVVVGSTTAESTVADGAGTVELTLTNVSDAPVALDLGAMTPRGCVTRVEPAFLARGQSTPVTLTLRPVCVETTRAVDLDGAGPIPAVTVSPAAAEAPGWSGFGAGAVVGVLAALVVLGVGLRAHRRAREEFAAAAPQREARLAQVQAIVAAREADLGPGDDLPWDPEWAAPAYSLSSTVAGLTAGWSFKDSLVANLTAGSAAFFALVSSSDVLTSVLGDSPDAAIGLMTLASLLATALVAAAGVVVLALGTAKQQVTVLGLVLSTSLVVLAVAFEVTAVAVTAWDPLGGGGVALGCAVVAGVVGVVTLAYGWRTVTTLVGRGADPGLPAVPDDALDVWHGVQPWEQAVVRERLERTYATWLAETPDASTPWMPPSGPGPVAPPAAPTYSLL